MVLMECERTKMRCRWTARMGMGMGMGMMKEDEGKQELAGRIDA
jgi:hypothetical protein